MHIRTYVRQQKDVSIYNYSAYNINGYGLNNALSTGRIIGASFSPYNQYSMHCSWYTKQHEDGQWRCFTVYGVRTSPSHANLPQGFFRLILTECKACSRTSISRAHTNCLMGTLRPACEPFSQEGESQSVTLRLLPPYCSLNITIFIDVDKGLHPVTSITVSMLRSALAQGRE